jgi:type IV secretory pathway VirB3-like protein
VAELMVGLLMGLWLESLQLTILVVVVAAALHAMLLLLQAEELAVQELLLSAIQLQLHNDDILIYGGS